MARLVSRGCCGRDGDHLSATKGDGGGGVGLLRRRPRSAHVFAGHAIPSFRTVGRHLALADVAAMDAVEGRAGFARSPLSRFGK
ncbi:hypothetical protein HOE425_331215 [Hoeflea sp. EC-HK425]|nr:hypothetical protein HOE425_331215 [Hoeflea sp. EC-HK425]